MVPFIVLLFLSTSLQARKLLEGKQDDKKLFSMDAGLIISELDGMVTLGVRPPASEKATGSERMLGSVPSPGIGN